MKLQKTVFAIMMVVLVAGFTMSCNQTTQNNEEEAVVENAESNVKFYRHTLFSETPYDLVKGTHELTAEQAAEINNYKFTFDSLQRLSTIEFNRNDVLLAYSRVGGSKVVIEYSDNQEIHTYFNKDNEQIATPSKVYTAVYDLNENGVRVGLKFMDEAGNSVENRNKITSYTWSILEDGMVKENRFNLAGEEVVLNESCPFYELRFSYDENGFATRMANYTGDSLYNCTAENCGDVGVSYFTFTNDEKGGLLDFGVYSMDGEFSNLFFGWARFTHKLDENGYVIERTYFDQNEEYMQEARSPIRQYTYDVHGSVVEIKMLNKEGELRNNNDNGIAVVQYKYDEIGHAIDTLSFDKEMVVIESK